MVTGTGMINTGAPAAAYGGIPKVPSMASLQQHQGLPSGPPMPKVASAGSIHQMHGMGLPVPPPLPGQPLMQPATMMPTGAKGLKSEQLRDTLPAAFEKKLRRLEKNRESARECRRRKKEHVVELQTQVARLEAENLRLKLQLKVGEESEAQERQEKERITKKLDDMVKNGASEADIWQTIDMFKERYSDYGSDRRSAIDFHVNQLEKLLLPTKLTKLCMWMMLHLHEEGALVLRKEAASSSSSGQPVKMEESTPAVNGGAAVAVEGDGQSSADKAPTAEDLWVTLTKELEVTDAQQKLLFHQRDAVDAMEADLEQTLGMLHELRQNIADKNSSLDQELHEVQKILSPTQTAKFILWITQNPACMHMLNQLWHHIYEKNDDGTPAMPGAPDTPTAQNEGGGGGDSDGASQGK